MKHNILIMADATCSLFGNASFAVLTSAGRCGLAGCSEWSWFLLVFRLYQTCKTTRQHHFSGRWWRHRQFHCSTCMMSEQRKRYRRWRIYPVICTSY